MKRYKHIILLLLTLPTASMAISWNDLWQTRDQQAVRLLQQGHAGAAAQVFSDKNWQAVSHYRSGNYKEAYQQFADSKTSDGQYNSGNAAAYMGKYQEAIAAYDKAIALNPNNQDAVANREIVKQLLQQQQKQNNQDQDKQDQDKQDQDKQNQQNQNQKNQDSKQQDKKSQKQDNQNQNKQDQNKQDQNKQNNTDNKDQNKQQPQNNTADSNQQKTSPQSQENSLPAANSRNQEEENNKQLLRRLADDPGGLLQQKFLRDYARRHGIDSQDNQGAFQQ